MESRKYWLVVRLVSSQWPEYGEHHCGTPLMCSDSVPVPGGGGGHHWPPASVARRPRGSPLRSLASTCCRVPDLRAVIVKYYCQISFQPREGESEQSMVRLWGRAETSHQWSSAREGGSTSAVRTVIMGTIGRDTTPTPPKEQKAPLYK